MDDRDLGFSRYGSDNPCEDTCNDPSMWSPSNNYHCSLDTERSSRDRGKLNGYGRSLIDICKASGLRIVNGRTNGDMEGELTYIGVNGSSVVDYFLCDKKSFESVIYMKVLDKIPESDHCPISLCLRAGTVELLNMDISRSPVYKYSGICENIINLAHSLNQCTPLLDLFYACISENMDVNCVTSSWNDYMVAAMDVTFPKVRVKKRQTKVPWLDQECKYLRSQLNACQDENERAKLSMQYNSIKQRKKRQYKIRVRNDLDTTCDKNPKVFWKILNNLPNNNSKNGCYKIQRLCIKT
jgi:hypothetical protein